MGRKIIIGNPAGWCKACWEKELKENNDIYFCDKQLPYSGKKFFERLCLLHYSAKINKRIRLPFKRIWYKNFFKTLNMDSNVEATLFVYDWALLTFDFKFLKYLRNKCKNIKIIYMFTNVVRGAGATAYKILDKIGKHYNQVFAFDKLDAEKYGFDYSPLMYTRSDTEEKAEITSDIFYVGQAKDRLNQILCVYEKATAIGLKCDFHIVGVPIEKQKYTDGIKYNEWLTYDECLAHIKSARCLLDATQGNSSGLTIKVCEAVIYDKKLISTNPYISKESFYNPGRILEYSSLSEQSLKSFMEKPDIKYIEEEKAIFSPKELYKKIK